MQREREDMATLTAKATVRYPIAEIRVAGFKSISEEQGIEIKPLTILAGANSSGKSSMMQPLLLLKQTLEASYDPGPIRLDGPNVKFTMADQLLSRIGKAHSSGSFRVGAGLSGGDSFQTSFRKEHKTALSIERTEFSWAGKDFSLWPEMIPREILNTYRKIDIDLSKAVPEGFKEGQWEIKRDRCFIGPVWVEAGTGTGTGRTVGARPGPVWEEIIPRVIHLPGLRGNRERAYGVAAVGPPYPGTFEEYTASVISHWENEKDEPLDQLNKDLKFLKLAGGVTAVRLNDVQIELHVGRLPDIEPTRPENRVNIADVGLGVSQTLPLLVALHAAKPGELVFVEQPETHLHPQAQFALAQILASAADGGVRVVAETHSSLLLLGVATLVAEGKLDPDKVKLHWFQRDKHGKTTVQSGELDEAGRSGDWPLDFDDVTLLSQKRFLDAASKRMFAQ
jgi:hypothetical protein